MSQSIETETVARLSERALAMTKEACLALGVDWDRLRARPGGEADGQALLLLWVCDRVKRLEAGAGPFLDGGA